VLRLCRSGLQFNQHLEHPGNIVFRHACKMGLEGIVSKRLGSRYISGRSCDWLKFKNPDAPAVKREFEEDWDNTAAVTWAFEEPSSKPITMSRAARLNRLFRRCLTNDRGGHCPPSGRPRLHHRIEPSSKPIYAAWKILAGEDLLQRHDVKPGIIPERLWRKLYIRGMTPQKAADQTAVSPNNTISPADRLKRLKR
jgi:hypothetical protein